MNVSRGLSPTVQHFKGLPPNLLDYLASQNIYLSQSGGGLRISPDLHNHARDAEVLLKVLEGI